MAAVGTTMERTQGRGVHRTTMADAGVSSDLQPLAAWSPFGKVRSSGGGTDLPRHMKQHTNVVVNYTNPMPTCQYNRHTLIALGRTCWLRESKYVRVSGVSVTMVSGWRRVVATMPAAAPDLGLTVCDRMDTMSSRGENDAFIWFHCAPYIMAAGSLQRASVLG